MGINKSVWLSFIIAECTFFSRINTLSYKITSYNYYVGVIVRKCGLLFTIWKIIPVKDGSRSADCWASSDVHFFFC